MGNAWDEALDALRKAFGSGDYIGIYLDEDYLPHLITPNVWTEIYSNSNPDRPKIWLRDEVRFLPRLELSSVLSPKELAIFSDIYSKIESQAKVKNPDTRRDKLNETPDHTKRMEDFKEWCAEQIPEVADKTLEEFKDMLKQEEIDFDGMTWDEIHGELMSRDTSLWGEDPGKVPFRNFKNRKVSGVIKSAGVVKRYPIRLREQLNTQKKT